MISLFKIDTQQLTNKQISRLKNWLTVAIVAVLFGQSVVSYLLVFAIDQNEAFHTEMAISGQKVSSLHKKTVEKIARLLDLDHKTEKQNRPTHTVPTFNLYCESLVIELPSPTHFSYKNSPNYLYLNLYQFYTSFEIPHPPCVA